VEREERKEGRSRGERGDTTREERGAPSSKRIEVIGFTISKEKTRPMYKEKWSCLSLEKKKKNTHDQSRKETFRLKSS